MRGGDGFVFGDGGEGVAEVGGGGFALAFGGAEVEVVDAALVEGGAGGGKDDDFGRDAGAGEFGEELFLIEEGEGADLEEFLVLHDLGHEEVGFGVDEVEREAVFEGFRDGVDFGKEGVGGVAER